MYSREWRGLTFDGTLAWGRNRRSTAYIPVVGGFYFFPGGIAQALLGEATVLRGPHAAIVRMERAEKDELFPLEDPRHSTLFPVSRMTLGYAFRIVRTGYMDAQLGAAGSWNRVPSALDSVYGHHPRSGLFFARLTLH